MGASEITILRGLGVKLPPGERRNCLLFQELREQMVRGQAWKHLFSYRRASLYTHRIDLLNKPFTTAVLLRLLSHGRCTFEDETGQIQPVGSRLLAKLLAQMVKDAFEKRRVLREISDEVESLIRREAGSVSKKTLDLDRPPLYLRTDLVYALQSGGSVGHIAGVLNHLARFTGNPIFITTDRIPTVDGSIETHMLRPLGRFRDFSELPSIEFNRGLHARVSDVTGNRRPAFVYQRYSLNNYTALKLSRTYGVPFVLEFNGSEIWVSRNWGSPLKYESLSERIEWLNLMAADVVVVVSRAIQDELVGRGIKKEKILINPNGVDQERYRPQVDGTEVRERLKLTGKTVIGFIGTFGRWHGAEVFAEAFGRLLQEWPEYSSRVRLLMIGDGITMPLVKENLTRYHIESVSVLTGLIPQEEGPSYLAACDILVSPHVPNPDGTPFFGSPTKLFEYMAMGKGIVASDLDQIGEVLRNDHTAWLVKPGDPDALKDGLKVLIDDPIRRARLGDAARGEVISSYTWCEHARKIIEKLKERCG